MAVFVSDGTIFVASALRKTFQINRRIDRGIQTNRASTSTMCTSFRREGAGVDPGRHGKARATYNLEMAVRCPHCDEAIRTIRIVGLSRSQVAFTSTLPRKGRIAICPECDRILPVELSGMLCERAD